VWRFEGKLFLELARARDRLRRELRANVVACVFFADPDPDEVDRVWQFIDEHSDALSGLVFNPVAQENNLFVFDGSKVAYDTELRRYEADADATEDRVRAAIALAEARLAGNDDIHRADIIAALKGEGEIGAQGDVDRVVLDDVDCADLLAKLKVFLAKVKGEGDTGAQDAQDK